MGWSNLLQASEAVQLHNSVYTLSCRLLLLLLLALMEVRVQHLALAELLARGPIWLAP